MVTARSSGSRADTFRVNFETYLNDFGTTVSRIRTTETLDSMNRITSTSTSTETYKADIQWVTKRDLLHLNVGDVKVGDGMIFFLNTADIEIEDEIEFNSRRWRIVEQIEGEIVGGEVIYKGYIIRLNAQT